MHDETISVFPGGFFLALLSIERIFEKNVLKIIFNTSAMLQEHSYTLYFECIMVLYKIWKKKFLVS